jgi:hypothetical protein
LDKKYKSKEYIEKRLEEKANHLRKCTRCGLEAKSIDDLHMFTPSKGSEYGRQNKCKSCTKILDFERKQDLEIAWLNKHTYYRKCNDCGLEANNERSLILFIECNRTPFNHRNLCKVCNAKRKNHILQEDIRLYKRKCTTCGLEGKTLEDLENNFVINKNMLHGYSNFCLSCRSKERIKAMNENIELRIQDRKTSRIRSVKKRSHPKQYSYDSELEEFLIDTIYETCLERANKFGIHLHVDHIYPLNSNLMSGLHISSNLQIVTAEYNLMKQNKVGKEFPEQENVTSLSDHIGNRDAPYKVFQALGCNMTWEDFLVYEKKYYKDSLYE